MHPSAQDLFHDEEGNATATGWAGAFEDWRLECERQGTLRERSSIDVYRSMWGALAVWCAGRGLSPDHVTASQLEAYLHSRGGPADLTPRHAWRLLRLVESVLAHRAKALGQPPNPAAHTLLMATPEWRHANAAHKTPLPGHLGGGEARRLVAWLLDPASDDTAAGAPARSWQALRNRTGVALQLGAGLTPGDVRAATLDGVVSEGGRAAGLPWKLRLPAHGGMPAREAPLAPWAGRLLRRWLDARHALQIPGPALFPSTRSGRPWGKVAQYGAARAVLEAAGLPDADGGSFRLRHTFALRQLRRGSSPEQVAQWMGLSDKAALARYGRVLIGPVGVV